MNRILAAATALALLSGCPLPQPLADYPAGTVTPPRILMDGLSPRDAVIRVPAGCASAPSWDLAAALVDTNVDETVTARWFVDYDPQNSARCRVVASEDIQGPGEQAQNPTHRPLDGFHFAPYDYPVRLGGGSSSSGPGVVHVVELVVSNRFDATADDGALCGPGSTTPFPFRTAARDGTVQFETQTYRWIFVSEPASAELPCR